MTAQPGTPSVFILWMILLVLFYVGFVIIPRLLLRQAVSQIVERFRQSHSLCSESPKTADELGLGPQSLTDRLFRFRDYRPYALQVLIKFGIVRLTQEGKMCLLEDKLPSWDRQKA